MGLVPGFDPPAKKKHRTYPHSIIISILFLLDIRPPDVLEADLQRLPGLQVLLHLDEGVPLPFVDLVPEFTGVTKLKQKISV